MSNNYRVIYRRRFLIESLPEMFSPRDSHWQIFDNYIEKTRIRLRKIRVPETKSWTRVLEQRFPVDKNNFTKIKISKLFLNEAEYKTFEYFKGREIRKNRYFVEHNANQIAIDIFLGNLWGLNIGLVEFENENDLSNFEFPDFSIGEITQNKFFQGENLVDKTFEDVQEEFTKTKGES